MAATATQSNGARATAAALTGNGKTSQTASQDAAVLDEVIRKTEARQGVMNKAAEYLMLPDKSETVYKVLRNVWAPSKDQAPLTDQEIFIGLALIAKYELDPFAKEIYVTRGKGGKIFSIVSIDGWIKILTRTEGYDGFEVTFSETADRNGTPDWIETAIYSTKRSRPTKYRAFRHEYEKFGGFVAGTAPIHMLRIFSLRHAARLFAPIGGGVVCEEELPIINRITPTEHAIPTVPISEVVDATEAEQARADQPTSIQIPGEIPYPGDSAPPMALAHYGLRRSNTLRAIEKWEADWKASLLADEWAELEGEMVERKRLIAVAGN